MSASALIYWHLEKTWSVQSINTIIYPKKDYGEVYKRGDMVEARFSGTVYPGLIVQVSNNRENLKATGALVGVITSKHGPGELLPEELLLALRMEENSGKTSQDQTAYTELNKDFHREKKKDKEESTTIPQSFGECNSDDNEDQQVCRPIKKARKNPTDENEAQKAKKDFAKKKRDVSKSREKLNQLASSALIDGASTDTEKVASSALLDVDFPSSDSKKLTAIITSTNNMLELMGQMVQRQASMEQQLAEMASCRQCIKALYKKLKPNNSTQLSPRTPSSNIKHSVETPRTPSSTFLCDVDHQPAEPPCQLSTCTVEPVKEPPTCSADHIDNDHQLDGTQEDNDELTYLGDSQYGILVNRKRLVNCEMASAKIDKLALNILELLVTKEECANLSIYGQAKGKVALAPCKRKALRSHLFKIHRIGTEEEKETLWSDIVKKLNDKIRGIKNNKYKL